MSTNTESKLNVRSWAFGGILISMGFITLLHLEITGLLPEEVYDLFVLKNTLIPLAINQRYIWRGLLVFSCAYGSSSGNIVFQEPNPNGIWYFGIGSIMLLYGYMPDYDYFNAFVFPLTPFVVIFNAKHLPKFDFKRKRREDYYNHYNRRKKQGNIEFPLQKERKKSVVEEDADFSKPLSLEEPDETTIVEAGTGKGKSRGCVSHYIESCVKNGWNVVVHDYKGDPNNPEHPELTKFALDAIARHKLEYDTNIIGFTDAAYSKQCNIYDPAAIKTEQDITSVNQSLMYSLNKTWAKESGSSDPFWKDNAISLIDGITLTLKRYRPELLTLPHLVATTVRDTDEIIDAFMNVPDQYLKMYFQSFKNAYNLAKETAGSIVSSAQIPFVRLNDSVMFWVLSGTDRRPDDFFSLDFKTDVPFVLSVCNNANMSIHKHGVNTYLKSILSRLRDSTNRPTAFIIDEFDQVYIDELDGAIATVRSAGTKIFIVLQTKKQLEDKMGKPYADKIMDLAQNKIFGGGSSRESIRDFVDGYVPKYHDLKRNVSSSGTNDETSGMSTDDKKVLESPEILGQEKFHFTGVLSTGEPNTFFNLPFKVNTLDLKSLKLPMMNHTFEQKYNQMKQMKKILADGSEDFVTDAQAKVSFDQYVTDTLDANRDRIFREAEEFITDLKNGNL